MTFTSEILIKLRIAFAGITAPLSPNRQSNTLEPVSAEEVEPDEIDLAETVELGDVEASKYAKLLRKTASKARQNAFVTLIGLPRIIENNSIGWSMFLLCLLSVVADVVIGTLPSFPIIVLKGLTTAPRALRVIVEAFSPFRDLTGKKSRIKRPAIIEAATSLGSTSISTDPVDYFGGTVRVNGCGKLKAWLPPALVPIVVATNAPTAIASTLLASSPLALLIFCGSSKINSSRFTFRWDGTAFETFDLDFLDRVAAQMSIIQSELLCFAEFIRAKKGRRNRIIEGMADFYPVAHSGRFTKVLDANPEVRIWAAALSTLRELLRFASDKAGWCSREEAERWLSDAWTAVLPESSPTPPSENVVAVRGDSVGVFWDFLTGYVRDHLPLIADKPRSDPAAIATLATFSDERYIVFPRRQLFAAYNTYLDQHGGAPLSDAKDGIELAHLLHDVWALPIRTERNNNEEAGDRGDLTWRYQFYAKGTAPDGQRDKLPCIAIPQPALPDELRGLLGSCSGHGLGEGNTPPSARTSPDCKILAEVTGNG